MLTKEQIAEGMKDRNISYVADAIGTNKTYLYDVLAGKRNMGPKVQRKLSDYLKQKQWSKR